MQLPEKNCSFYDPGNKLLNIEKTGKIPWANFQYQENIVAMKKDKHSRYFVFVILAISLITGCANTPNLVGRWKEIGKTATLELSEDGTFKAVDNQKMAVSGKYSLIENGKIRFDISRPGSPPDIVNGNYSMQGDILILTSSDGKEIQRYRRQK